MPKTARPYFIGLIVVPAGLVLAAYGVSVLPYTKYVRAIYGILAFVLTVDLAVTIPGRWRKAVVPIASLVFCLATAEFLCAFSLNEDGSDARGFSVPRAELGWGPQAPGLYRGFRKSADGTTIYDVTYTIDRDLLRETRSGSGGSGVAVFGDSMTFGQGLPDSQTLPQVLAVLASGELRVRNFAFPGYGPQQFLRALELGIFDELLKDTSLFVYQAVGWQVERASCRAAYMARAPRYELHDGTLAYKGACAEGWRRIYSDVVLGSTLYQRLIAPWISRIDAHDVEVYVAELGRCAEIVKRRYGARLVILYAADSDAYLASAGFTDAKIEDGLRRRGMDVLDDTLHEKDFAPGTELAIPGDGHPTAVANRARAEMLRKFLAAPETFPTKRD